METPKNVEGQSSEEKSESKRPWQKPVLVQLPIRNTAGGATSGPEGIVDGSPVGTQS